MELVTTTPARTIEQDMTAEELELFHSPFEEWGDAQAAVERGVAYLDRVMPGWADKVEIWDLDLGSSCKCVLGQIFHTEAVELRDAFRTADQEAWIAADRNLETYRPPVVTMAGNGPLEDPSAELEDGFNLGITVLGLKHAESGTSDGARDLNAAYFFGFDHTEAYGYGELTEAWTEAIDARKSVNA